MPSGLRAAPSHVRRQARMISGSASVVPVGVLFSIEVTSTNEKPAGGNTGGLMLQHIGQSRSSPMLSFVLQLCPE